MSVELVFRPRVSSYNSSDWSVNRQTLDSSVVHKTQTQALGHPSGIKKQAELTLLPGD